MSHELFTTKKGSKTLDILDRTGSLTVVGLRAPGPTTTRPERGSERSFGTGSDRRGRPRQNRCEPEVGGTGKRWTVSAGSTRDSVRCRYIIEASGCRPAVASWTQDLDGDKYALDRIS